MAGSISTSNLQEKHVKKLANDRKSDGGIDSDIDSDKAL